MQGASFFDNEIIRPENLNFWRDSNEKNIKDNFLALTKGFPGILTGFTLTPTTSGVSVSQGIGYDADGEQVNLSSSGSIISVPAGKSIVFASKLLSNYDWNGNYVLNTDPVSGSGVITSVYNLGQISVLPSGALISGSSPINIGIPLGLISGDSFGNVTIADISETYRWDLKIAKGLNLNNFSINGAFITPNSILTSSITNPWTHDIKLSDVSILPLISGASNLATHSVPFSNLYCDRAFIHEISGMSPIIMHDITMYPGSSIESTIGNPVYLDKNSRGVVMEGSLYVPWIKGLSSNSWVQFNNTDLNLYARGSVNITSNANTIISAPNVELMSIGSVNVSAPTFNIHGNEILTGNSTVVGALTVSSNASIYGNLSVNGQINNLQYSSTNQSYDNLILNPEFASINQSGTTPCPAFWNLSSGNFSPMFSVKDNTSDYYGTNILYDEPGLMTYGNLSWVSPLSGNGIVLSIPIDDLVPKQAYNISYFYKNISSFAIADNITINTFVSGSSYNSGILKTTTANNYLTWTRVSMGIAAPIIPSGLSLCLQVTASGSSNNNLGITGIQVTKGNALLPYRRSLPIMCEFTHLQGSSPNWYVEGDIYSRGQLVSITGFSSSDISQRPGNPPSESAAWWYSSSNAQLKVDGVTKQIDSQNFVSAATNFGNGSYSAIPNSLNTYWQGYLPKGKHHVRLEIDATKYSSFNAAYAFIRTVMF